LTADNIKDELERKKFGEIVELVNKGTNLEKISKIYKLSQSELHLIKSMQQNAM